MRHLTWMDYDLERIAFEQPRLVYRDTQGTYGVGIRAGKRDEIEVFREHGITYALSYNLNDLYCALQAFRGHEEIASLSFTTLDAVTQALGKTGLELTPMSMAKRLARQLQIQPARSITTSEQVEQLDSLHAEELNQPAPAYQRNLQSREEH